MPPNAVAIDSPPEIEKDSVVFNRNDAAEYAYILGNVIQAIKRAGPIHYLTRMRLENLQSKLARSAR